MKTPIKPHITEKSYQLSTREVAPVYTFAITADHSKPLVKKLVETEYNVTVETVNIVKNPGKARRFKGIHGTTQPTLKAIVRLKKGQTIPAFDIDTTEKGEE